MDHREGRALRNRDDLFITEELLLLALRDEKRTVAPGLMINYTLSGAALADLLLQNRIGVEEGRKNPRVRILSSDPLGDPVLDQCLERIAAAKRSAPLRTWVTRFGERVCSGGWRKGSARGGSSGRSQKVCS